MNDSSLVANGALWKNAPVPSNSVMTRSRMHDIDRFLRRIGADDRNVTFDHVDVHAETGQARERESSRLAVVYAAIMQDVITHQQRLAGQHDFREHSQSGFAPQSTANAKNVPREAQIAAAKFFKNIIVVWNLSYEDMAVLLGQDHLNSNGAHEYVETLLGGEFLFCGSDTKDRMAQLLQIRRVLSSLFQNGTVESQWLREPQQVLDGKSPMALMLDGHMESLSLAREFVEAAAGL